MTRRLLKTSLRNQVLPRAQPFRWIAKEALNKPPSTSWAPEYSKALRQPEGRFYLAPDLFSVSPGVTGCES